LKPTDWANAQNPLPPPGPTSVTWRALSVTLWLAVGGPRSGRTTLLRTVLAEAVRARSPEELHVHVLDHGGGGLATEAATLPHAGTTIGAGDALRTVRLVARLAEKEKRAVNITMVGKIIREMQQNPDPNSIRTIASQNNISSRYLSRLFLQYTGVTPKLYDKIHRFQQSLRLITENRYSLTSIAYDCGYFDQSHFIRDFKHFAGITPSSYSPEAYPVAQALVNS